MRRRLLPALVATVPCRVTIRDRGMRNALYRQADAHDELRTRFSK